MYLRTLELHLCSGGVARRLQERRHWSNTLLLVYWPGTLNCLWILIKLLLYLFFWLRLLNNWRAWSNTMLINFLFLLLFFIYCGSNSPQIWHMVSNLEKYHCPEFCFLCLIAILIVLCSDCKAYACVVLKH